MKLRKQHALIHQINPFIDRLTATRKTAEITNLIALAQIKASKVIVSPARDFEYC